MTERHMLERMQMISVHLGMRIREQRTRLGMSLKQLSLELGITVHQLQKYETGENRFCAAQIPDFSRALRVPIAYFFDDFPEALRRGPASDQRLTSPGADDRDIAPVS